MFQSSYWFCRYTIVIVYYQKRALVDNFNWDIRYLTDECFGYMHTYVVLVSFLCLELFTKTSYSQVAQSAEGQPQFDTVLTGLLQRILDSNKRVQEAACSAFATLEEVLLIVIWHFTTCLLVIRYLLHLSIIGRFHVGPERSPFFSGHREVYAQFNSKYSVSFSNAGSC